MVEPVRVGIIGCGIISEGYLRNLRQFRDLEVVACADLEVAKAKARAEEFGVAGAGEPSVVLEDEQIEIVVNLTVPSAHHAVSLAAIEHGKSVWSEKPLALTVEEARELVERAKERGVAIGCAPDTWLGGGLQSSLRLIEDGVIGELVSATAFLHNRGAEQRRPDPEFYYKPGVGPLYDMGPYYVTALVAALGPVGRVSATGRATFAEREVVIGPNAGRRFPVEVMTDVSALLDFASGPIGVMTMSSDVWVTTLPKLEVYGTQGSISLPDPNRFDGHPKVWTVEERTWREVAGEEPYTSGLRFGNRGLGVAELAGALREGRAPRAGGDLALHVLEVLEGITRSAETGQRVAIESRVVRPALLARSQEFVELPGLST